jgi:hypothetical protein
MKTGLPIGGFYFSNFGTAWRHFGAFMPQEMKTNSSGFVWRVEIGFRRQEDQIAATEAEEKRPTLFKVGVREASEYFENHIKPALDEAFKQAFSI